MADPIDVAAVREHLRLDDVTPSDAAIERMIAAAKRGCEAFTGLSLADDADPPLADGDLETIGMAMLMMIANWYRNPEGVSVDARGTPAEVQRCTGWLLNSIRNRSL